MLQARGLTAEARHACSFLWQHTKCARDARRQGQRQCAECAGPTMPALLAMWETLARRAASEA